MAVLAPVGAQRLAAFNGASGRPAGLQSTFFFDTRGHGIPRRENLLGLRLLEDTHAVQIPMTAIRTQISNTPWMIRAPEGITETSKHRAAAEEIEVFLDGGFNQNGETFSDLTQKIVGDVLSIDAGILELVPNEEGLLEELYVRDGLTFTKAHDRHGRFPTPGSPEPAYWQFSLNATAGSIDPKDSLYDLFRQQIANPGSYRPFHPIPFARDQIAWFEHYPRSWDPYGLGRVQLGRRVIEVLLNQDMSNLNYFRINEVPDGLLHIAKANKDEIERFRAYWTKEIKGREHKLPIVGGEGANYIPFRPSLADLQYLDSQKWYHEMMWLIFGVGPSEVGHVEDVNRANGEEQASTVYRKTTRPLLENIARKFNRCVLPFLDAYRRVNGELEFTYDLDTNPAIKALRRTRQKEDLESGLTTINEIRMQRGEDPLPWGDMTAEMVREVTRRYPRWVMERWARIPEEELPADAFEDIFGFTTSTPAEGDSEEAPAEEAPEPETPLEEDLQDQGLNGAQVGAILEVIENYNLGLLGREEAIAIIEGAFPFLDPEKVQAMVPSAPAADTQSQPEEETEDPKSEPPSDEPDQPADSEQPKGLHGPAYDVLFRSNLQVVKEALRDEPAHNYPAVKGLLDGLTAELGQVFRGLEDDVVAATKKHLKSTSFDITAILDEIDITPRLRKAVVAAGLAALKKGAEFHAAKAAKELQARLGDDVPAVAFQFEVTDSLAAKKMAALAAHRMVTVNETIKILIRETLVQVVQVQGGNVGDATRAIRSLFSDQITETHARLVARTEILSASRRGGQAFAESTPLIAGKGWRATGDNRTRAWHAVMDGVIVPKDSVFIVPVVDAKQRGRGYPKRVEIPGEDEPYNCRCDYFPVLADDLPALLELGNTPGLVRKDPPAFTEGMPRVQRGVLFLHGLPGESFDACIRRLYKAAGSKHSLSRSLGVPRTTLYGWLPDADGKA